ncbi:spore coat associated protein CotJA [Paraclostridium bifermentans]|uniref:spore coat associated protein CotJA n=1 Tax=Paraclostridium bifermentans TaxID=1490 RepID=UPI00189A516D|nr:spore coat associated protein CotJA [Paraclostridium bifermentans]MDU3337485.1 spore coat associated protein CotJA [Paraclostridium bifermentans]
MNDRNDRIVKKNCGCELARPYVNDQVFCKMYNLSKALQYGTIFPELNLWESSMYNKDLYRYMKKINGGKR